MLQALVGLGGALITASIIYQVVKPGSQGPAVVNTISQGLQGITNTIYKG